MRRSLLVWMTAAAPLAPAVAAPAALAAQEAEAETEPWRFEGLRTAFCIQFLLDPAAEALRDLPEGFQPVPAADAPDLHVSLRSVVEARPEFGPWSPARLCFHAVDTVVTDAYTLTQGGKHPLLFALWTVLAAAPGSPPHEVAVELLSNSDRLIRSARLAGHHVRSARLTVGLVPVEDENGIPSSEERFQVKIGKALITWDGRLVGDSSRVAESVRTAWDARGGGKDIVSGELVLSPTTSRPMAGSLKVDGKGDLAKLLRASPTRFAGPAYRGGGGTIRLRR